MLARLASHVKRMVGILFLVLPTRCVTSKAIGGLEAFTAILNAVGLVEVSIESLEKKVSPKLTYFVLQSNHVCDTLEEVLEQACKELRSSKRTERFVHTYDVGRDSETKMASISEFNLAFIPPR